MANKRTALSLVKKLTALDSKIEAEIMKENYSLARLERLQEQRGNLLLLIGEKLPVITIQVRDGGAVYHETKRTKTLVTFEWLYGGPDGYKSDWGKVVAIPVAQADGLIKQYYPCHI